MLREELENQSVIGDVAVHKPMTRIITRLEQRLQVARVGKKVQGNDRRSALAQPLAHKVRTNEACASGHKNGNHVCRHVSRHCSLSPRRMILGRDRGVGRQNHLPITAIEAPVTASCDVI
jgi:hypothetical protein